MKFCYQVIGYGSIREDGLKFSQMWVSNFPFSVSSWVFPKIGCKSGRKIIIIIRRRRSHKNNSQLYRFASSIAAANQQDLFIDTTVWVFPVVIKFSVLEGRHP